MTLPKAAGAQRDYSDEWRVHRRLRRLPLLVIAVAVACTFAAGHWPHLREAMDIIEPMFVAFFVATMIYVNVKVARFPCPRCSQRFNANLRNGIGLRDDAGKACGNCGLPLYG